MSKSIMHRKEDKTCYLCMKLHHNYSRHGNLEEHHVMYGGQNRRISEKYGLKVYLCINHHTYDGGPEAVHRNDAIRRLLEKDAQRAFEKAYPELNFREIFGKNVLDESERQQVCQKPAAGIPDGFITLEEAEDEKADS